MKLVHKVGKPKGLWDKKEEDQDGVQKVTILGKQSAVASKRNKKIST